MCAGAWYVFRISKPHSERLCLAFEPFNYRTVAIQQIQQVKNKYESLDENKICGEVESGTPLSIYALNGNSGSFFGLKPLI